jgi:hypothetical protein
MGDIVLAMTRTVAAIVILLVVVAKGQEAPNPPLVSICELSKDYGAYRGKLLAVRGVYFYGLRETCPQKCADGPWPSFLDLVGTGDNTFDALSKVVRSVELEAKKGKRFEVWVTAVGQLETSLPPPPPFSPPAPCDLAGRKLRGYGHLSAFPAQITVSSFRDVEVKENPKSPYDYANMYHGPG